MRRAAFVTLALAFMLVAGCSDDGDGDASSTTEASTTTTTSPSTSTTAGPPACPLDPVDPAIDEASSAVLDADGDGEDDEALVYLDAGSRWHLRVTVADGGGAEITLSGSIEDAIATLGGGDVDGDGSDELFYRTGAGASAVIVSVARLTDCTLVPLTLGEGGSPAELPVGASVANTSGIACRGGELVTLNGTSNDGETYAVTETSYAIVGGALVESGARTTTVTATDPDFTALSRLVCDDLVL